MAKKSFGSIGGFLKPKGGDDGELDEKTGAIASAEDADAISIAAQPESVAVHHEADAAPVERIARLAAPQRSKPPARTSESIKSNVVDIRPSTKQTPVASTSDEKKKPGPKGRGDYIKHTIGFAKHLDEFVEEARRTHVRPDGTRTTIYGHFIEDLIAAEIQRRALRP